MLKREREREREEKERERERERYSAARGTIIPLILPIFTTSRVTH